MDVSAYLDSNGLFMDKLFFQLSANFVYLSIYKHYMHKAEPIN